MIGVDMGSRQRSRFGVYVHVPFCSSICSYCDFTKTGRFSKQDVDVFFEQALRQLRELIAKTPDDIGVCTLYFGGGTPGMFPAERYAPLLELVQRRFEIEECTMEMNPFHLSRGRFQALRAMGIGRITFGVQSLSEKALEFLGRRHKPSMALATLEQARAEGMDEVQVDLIYGLPEGLRESSLSDEIALLDKAGATGFSTYALTIETRTRLGLQKGVVQSDDITRSEYHEILESCAARGMTQLETANFSRFEAKHNNIYWFGWPYLAVGTGAHGLLPPTAPHPFGVRYQIGRDIVERDSGDDLLPFASEHERLFAIAYETTRTAQAYRDEMFFTLLRTSSGIPREWMRANGWDSVWEAWSSDSKIIRACEEGRLICNHSSLRLVGGEFLMGDGWTLLLLTIADRVKPCHST